MCIRDSYILSWKDTQGKEEVLFLPNLKPGEKYKVELKNLSTDEKVCLKITRPTGNSVIEY